MNAPLVAAQRPHRVCRSIRSSSGPVQHTAISRRPRQSEYTVRTLDQTPLADHELARIDAYWRAANYLTVGQIYLLDNALLQRPLVPADVKPRLLGHWGTSPGLNLIYAHLDRVIARDDLDVIYVTGPGHGGPAILANTWLEGTYTETYPAITRRGGDAAVVPAVLVPRWRAEPRRARDAGFDPRGRGARLLAQPRVRRGVRQSRSRGRVRRR